MRILLIDSPQKSVYGNLKEAFSKHPNLGLMHISANLKKEGHDIRVIDPEVQEINIDKLKDIINSFKPNIAGFSSMTSTIPWVYSTVKVVKAMNQKIITILGGYHATALPERTLKECPELDITAMGEGEYTLLELANNMDKDKIKGIAFRDGKNIAVNEKRPLLMNLDLLPMPDWDCLPLEKYKPHLHRSKSLKWTCVALSRGCPYDCYFCSSKIINQRMYRKHSVERVMEIFLDLKKRGFDYIRIVDDEFALDQQWVHSICNRIIENRLKIKWDCNGRINIVNKDLLIKMKKAGCDSVFYGCESGSQEILDKMNKKITTQQIIETAALTHKVGLNADLSWIIGNYWDNKETIIETINLAKKLNKYANNQYINFAIPLPGSLFWELVVKENKACYDWSKYTLQNEPIYIPKNMTKQELMHLMSLAHKKIFMSPTLVWNKLKKIRSLDDLTSNIKGFFILNKAINGWK